MLSMILILVGIVIMLLGVGVSTLPLSWTTVYFGDFAKITIGGINAPSATLIGVGAIIFVGGILLTAIERR